MTNATAKATIHTNYGDIVVDLFGYEAPLTVENFIGLADGTREWKHPRTGELQNGPLYKDVIFHRIIKGFMIQGGDPLGIGVGGPGYQFKDEIHPELTFSKPYLLAMANAGPGTNGSQFFITTDETPWLNGRHTIFGEVADEASKKVVDAIESRRNRSAGSPHAGCGHLLHRHSEALKTSEPNQGPARETEGSPSRI